MEKNNILVPVDFSSCSINALKNAANLARKKKATLTILHAVAVPVAYVQEIPVSTPEQTGELDKEINQNLEDLINQVPELKEIEHEFKVEYALSPDAIISYTLQNNIDLIVMGARGRSRRGMAFLGSNTFAVINAVRSPILAIPEGSEIKDVKKIILAVDYEEIPPYSSFEPLINLVRLFGAQVYIIHIGQKGKLDHEEISEAKVLEQYFKNIKHQYQYIVSGEEEDTILDYLKAQHAGLLAIISRKHSFVEKLQHQSLTRKMITNIQVPVLVLHEMSE